MFLTGAAVALVAFVLSWFITEVPLRKTVTAQGVGESFASPRDASSMHELAAQAATLARRENRHLVYEQLADAPGSTSRPRRCGSCSASTRAAAAAAAARPGVAAAGARRRRAGGRRRTRHVTAGDGDARAAADARCAARIQALLADWAPERHPEILEIVDRLTESLAEAPPEPVEALNSHLQLEG